MGGYDRGDDKRALSKTAHGSASQSLNVYRGAGFRKLDLQLDSAGEHPPRSPRNSPRHHSPRHAHHSHSFALTPHAEREQRKPSKNIDGERTEKRVSNSSLHTSLSSTMHSAGK